MSEFQEVIKEMKRMCAHFRPTCNGCPLCLGKGTNEFCGEQPLDIRSDPELVEAAVMAWAAEHPKPVYPTWWEYLEKIFDPEVTKYPNDYGMFGEACEHYRIPADIAQKLGIEPKEG